MQYRRKSERGVATLEGGAIFTIFIPVLLGAVAVLEATRVSGALEGILAQRVSSSGAAAYAVRGEDVRLDDGRMSAAFERTLDVMQADLCRALVQTCKGSQRYFVDLSLLEIGIDAKTGSWNGEVRLASSARRGAASAAELPGVVQAALPALKERAQARSQFAVPLGALSGGAAYLSSAPVVVARAVVDMRGSFSGDLLQLLNVAPSITTVKLQNLRAEIGS